MLSSRPQLVSHSRTVSTASATNASATHFCILVSPFSSMATRALLSCGVIVAWLACLTFTLHPEPTDRMGLVEAAPAPETLSLRQAHYIMGSSSAVCGGSCVVVGQLTQRRGFGTSVDLTLSTLGVPHTSAWSHPCAKTSARYTAHRIAGGPSCRLTTTISQCDCFNSTLKTILSTHDPTQKCMHGPLDQMCIF